MQTNSPYIVPVDQNPRNPTSISQPVLSRSLPSVAVSEPMPLDNVMVSGIYQSYVPLAANLIGTQSRAPMTVMCGIGDSVITQKQASIQNCPQNPISQPMTTVRSTSVQQQSDYSTVIPSTKISDKTKKKSKSKIKIKYQLKIIRIDDDTDAGTKMLTFEMMSPNSQTQFRCRLNKEINNLDVFNSDGESGQITQDLGKKDIIESMVNTVKMICQQLTEDIDSIQLNEIYLFHPCTPNSPLIKLSDYVVADNEVSVHQASSQSLQPSTNVTGGCASFRSLSKHSSNEDISLPMENISFPLTEPLSSSIAEYEAGKSLLTNVDTAKRIIKPAIDNEPNFHTIVSTKCTCPINDSILKVPEYIFPYVKQITDKLLNHNFKALIILPQSNDILTRNIRILEVPSDNMFVGIPLSDSSYNIVKCPKDKDFIIAKDNRNTCIGSVKCVYQKSTDGAVLLDSSGEIQHINNPTLVIPPKVGFGDQKTMIKELPWELTHHKDQSLNCDQIVSVLQSLTHSQNTTIQNKDELFDSPVMLEPSVISKSQCYVEKVDTKEITQRRGSDDVVVPQGQHNSNIQVERIFCEYVALHNTSVARQDDALPPIDALERDLPKQQVRISKLSDDSGESQSTNRNRALSSVVCVNDVELTHPHVGTQKAIPNTQINVPNIQKPLSATTVAFTNELEHIQSQPALQKINIQNVQKPNSTIGAAFSNDSEHTNSQSGLQKIVTNPQMNPQSVQKPLSISPVVIGNESEIMQPQHCLQKMIPNTQINVQNIQKPLSATTDHIASQTNLQKIINVNPQFQMGPIINQMPIQRKPVVPGSVPGQFLLSNPNTNNALSGSIFLQNVQNVPHYPNTAQGPVAPVVISQSSTNIPVVLTNQTSGGLNFSHILPNQIIHPSCITPGQMSQLQQMPQNPCQRLPAPSTIMPVNLNSSQLLSNIPQKIITVTEQIIPNQVYPVPLSSFADQHSLISSHPGDVGEQPYAALSRPIPQNSIRPMPPNASSQYYDPNIMMQLKSQPIINNQLQPQVAPVLIIPHPALSVPPTQNNPPPNIATANLKVNALETVPPPTDCQHVSAPIPEPEMKSEQIVGRFLIRPVSDKTDNS